MLIYTGGTGAGGGVVNLQDRPQMRVDGTRLISTGNVNAKTGQMFSFDFQKATSTELIPGRRSGRNSNSTGSAAAPPLAVSRPVPASVATISPSPTPPLSMVGTWKEPGFSRAKPRPIHLRALAINNEVGAFGNPIPSAPFSLDGDSWGTWELAARYSDTNLNYNSSQLATTTQLAGITGGDERIITLGVNWYLNRNVKLQVNDMIVKVKRSSNTSLTNYNNMSQDLNILGVRVAFAN